MVQDKLKQAQEESLEVLVEVDRVCRQLQIPYFITAGTLLGAVRHRGFIPWDDDIDLVMHRRDYARFFKEAPNILSEGFFLQDQGTDRAYPLGFGKVRKRGSQIQERLLLGSDLEMGAFVDIFPLDTCPEKTLFARLFFYGNNLVNYALLKRCNPAYQYPPQRQFSCFLCDVGSKLPNGVLFFLRSLLRRTASVVSRKNRLCTVSGRHGYPKETYPAVWFSETICLEFEGRSFCAPAYWHELLENMYGDYMTPVRDMESHIL